MVESRKWKYIGITITCFFSPVVYSCNPLQYLGGENSDCIFSILATEKSKLGNYFMFRNI